MSVEVSSPEVDAFRAAAGMLADEKVILTGATGGIGSTIARMLSAAGARLAITDLSADRVDALAAQLDCLGASVDVSSAADFRAFHDLVEQELGPPTGIVNCAGLWAPLPFEEIDEDAWTATLAGNLGTAFVTCQAVLPGMVARRRGSVVNFASTAGEFGSISAAAHYAAAKGGVVSMTKSLAREVSPHGVRINAVSPGPIDTAALGAATAEQKASVGARTLFNRLGQPHEIAGACVFLLSPLSTFMTGTVVQVNGGSLL